MILLLNEATSALDSESKKLVQNALEQASMGRTTLVVAHKLSTVKRTNQMTIVDSGTMVEIDTHDDLIINKNSLYSRLVRLQRIESYIGQDDAHRPSSPARSSASRLSLGKASPTSFLSTFSIEDHSTVSYPAPSFSRLLSMNLPEWKQAQMGSIFAIFFSLIQPTYAFSIGGMIATLYLYDHNEIRATILSYSLILFSLSVISMLTNILQYYNFAYIGEFLTRKIRLRVLEKILSFEAAWFDDEQNSSGTLCSRLGHEASLVKTLVADRVSLLVQTFSGVVIAMNMGLL